MSCWYSLEIRWVPICHDFSLFSAFCHQITKAGSPLNIRCWFVNSIFWSIQKLKWLPFPKYVEYQQAVTVYKSLNELNPHYMNKLFSHTQENHSYGTRNATSSLQTLPKCNKSIGQKCISYSGTKVWNSLTEAIRCAPSLPSFKSRYLKALYRTTL